MKIANNILSLTGSGVIPDPGQAIVEVPNTLIPTFSPRSPVAGFITAAPSSSIGDSHCAYGTTTQPAATAGFDVTLTMLSAGLWDLKVAYSQFIAPTVSNTVNANSAMAGIILRRDPGGGGPAIVINILPAMISSVINYNKDWVFNFSQDGWEIRYRVPTTIAGQTSEVSACVVASRLS